MRFILTGGELTEAIRRKPFAVVLLDEMEKAHRGWFENVRFQYCNCFKIKHFTFIYMMNRCRQSFTSNLG
jgi:hypothetical protein